ncbi:MAG TPA: S8 family serine peptidase, partial [Bacteroidota bacterium]|nr:S8 family serine peptidase [Bacteroidota bacterium]
MMKRTAAWLLLPLVSAGAFAGQALTGRLQEALQRSGPGEAIPVWIFFTDKGVRPGAPLPPPLSLVSARALQRRAAVLPADRIVDETDLPVCPAYIARVAPLVARTRQVSRWLNAVSAEATSGQIAQIEALPCVRTVDLLMRYRRVAGTEASPPGAARPAARHPEGTGALDYGESLPQVSLENIPAVNATGNSAQGIIIGMFDNGVRLPGHEAFDLLRPRIIAQHDFVDHKTSVVPNDPDPGFGAHGVYTLSTIAGYTPGRLIGPAYGASFILARTENDSSETPIEEDNWAAAIEWAESLGVQVTSTSLGYFDFDPGWVSLTWQDMNGHTAVISIAALMAARKGVIVVNSAGNDAE